MNTYLLNKQLPDTFQQVEYIQSSGTQYIDTGVNATLGNKIYITLQVTEIVNDTNYFGVYYSSSGAYYCEFSNYSSRFRFNLQDVSGTSYLINPQIDTTKKFNFIYENNKWYYEGQSYGMTQLANVSYSMYIFARHRADTSSVDKYSKMRLYNCKIYNSTNTLVRNFIPCYRKSDNVIGLYDTVNDIFYTNAGTGTFTKGSDSTLYDKKKVSTYLLKRIVPAEYQPVEYLQIHDSTQGILLSYTWSQISKIELGYMQLVDVTLSTRGAIILASHATNSFTSASPWVAANGKKDGSVAISPTGGALNTLYEFTVTHSSTSTNGIKIGGWNDDLWTMQGNYYYVRIYDTNQQLLCNLLPVKRITDNKPGLYDTINDVFYTNANTSASQDFTVGSNIDSFIKQKVAVKLLCSEVPSEYQQVEYLQGTGEQYIDSGINPNENLDVKITFNPTTVPTSGISAGIYGYRYSGQNTFGSQVFSDGKIYLDRGNSAINRTSTQYETNKKYSSISTKSLRAIYDENGTELSRDTSQPANTPTDNSIWLLGYNGTSFSYFTGKLYECRMFNNTTLIRNFIPCYRKADDKPGLYDTVNGVFYTNANTNTTQDFSVGPNKWIIK